MRVRVRKSIPLPGPFYLSAGGKRRKRKPQLTRAERMQHLAESWDNLKWIVQVILTLVWLPIIAIYSGLVIVVGLGFKRDSLKAHAKAAWRLRNPFHLQGQRFIR